MNIFTVCDFNYAHNNYYESTSYYRCSRHNGSKQTAHVVTKDGMVALFSNRNLTLLPISFSHEPSEARAVRMKLNEGDCEVSIQE